MSVVVSDASPLHYLILTHTTSILPKLFSKVVLPEQVVSFELQRPKTPALVRTWISTPPDWIEVLTPHHPESLNLHTGEEHAIALALELHSPILLDEKEARKVARRKGLVAIGTVGLLERAAEMGLIVLSEALAALHNTNMRISRSLIEEALSRDTRLQSRRNQPQTGGLGEQAIATAPDRLRRAVPEGARGALLPVAGRVFWWGDPGGWLDDAHRFAAQVMTFGDWDDTVLVAKLLGESVFENVLADPPTGVFDIKSWTFWHLRYGRSVPPLPARKL